MTEFPDLVDDLIFLIAQCLTTERDLNSLCCTTSHLHSLLNSLLYSQHVRFHGGSALTWAARYDRVNTAKMLLAAGADLLTRTNDGHRMPPLALAADYGSVGVTKLLFECDGIDLNWMEDGQAPALCRAAMCGEVEVIELYLNDPRVDPQLLDVDGETALFHAADTGRCQALEILLRDGRIDPSVATEGGQTALFYAAMSDWETAECIRVLLGDTRVDAFATDNYGRTALALAAKFGRAANVKALLEAGLDPDHQDIKGQTPLMYLAMYEGKYPCGDSAEFLIGHDSVSPNLVCKDGWTALMYAAASECYGVVERLLQHPDIDMNLISHEGNTALHYAIMNGNYTVARLLLEDKRLDSTRKDGSGRSPMVLAAAAGYGSIARFIWRNGRCLIDERDEKGRDAMSYAAAGGHGITVECLLEIGEKSEDVDWFREDKLGRDPFWYASNNGDKDTICVLERWILNEYESADDDRSDHDIEVCMHIAEKRRDYFERSGGENGN